MATCSIQDLLDDAACFYALPTGMQDAVALQLWCQIAEAIAPGVASLRITDEGDTRITDEGDNRSITP